MANTIRLVPEDDLNDKSTVAGSILAGLFEPKRGRSLVSVTTATVASGIEWTGTIPIGASYRIIAISTDKPCRVRIYATEAQRALDTARQIGIDPTGDHGLVFEYVSVTGVLGAALSPVVQGSNLETTPSVNSAISIQNRSGTSGTVQVTFTLFVSE